MGKPMPHYWYDPFVDMAWWAGAILGMATAGAPFIFYIVSSIIRADAKKGLQYKKGHNPKPTKYSFDTALIQPIEQAEQRQYFSERKPDPIVKRIAESNMFSDLAILAGAGEMHRGSLSSLGAIVEAAEGQSNYRR